MAEFSDNIRHARAPENIFAKLLVFSAFALCMSAPEDITWSHGTGDLNPMAGIVKLILLGIGTALLCRSKQRVWVLVGPFKWLMAWACVCWIIAGGEVLAFRNLASSFGGILVLSGVCSALEAIGGIRGLVRLLICALITVAITSVGLGLIGLQAMPGEVANQYQLELFHGVGDSYLMVAGCACLIAWVIGRYIAKPFGFIEITTLLLLLCPVLIFLRAFLIGILTSILVAALFAWCRHRRLLRDGGKTATGHQRLIILAVAMLLLGSLVLLVKGATREDGNELSGREIVWPIALSSVAEHPVIGLGPFGDIQLLRFDNDLIQVGAAHCEYLAAAVCYGLPGLFLFVWALRRIWKDVRRCPATSLDERACRYAALLSIVALVITITAENVIRDPRMFSLYLLFPSLCLSSAMTPTRPDPGLMKGRGGASNLGSAQI
jgi:hypothetical protein